MNIKTLKGKLCTHSDNLPVAVQIVYVGDDGTELSLPMSVLRIEQRRIEGGGVVACLVADGIHEFQPTPTEL
jgi:hypothetical protein